MTDSRHALVDAHDTHDLVVLAAATDRDASTAARAAATVQARDCGECAAFLADLRAISTTLAGLPREVAVPRDFRLTPERAAALRRRGWRELLATLTRGPAIRPLATALTTLGFAGLVLTVAIPAATNSASTPATRSAISAPGATSSDAGLPAGGGGAAAGSNGAQIPEVATASGRNGATSAPADQGSGFGSGGPHASGPGGGGGLLPQATPPPTALDVYGIAGSAAPASGGASSLQPGAGPTSPAAPPANLLAVLPWLSLAALVIGLALFLASRFGERARAG